MISPYRPASITRRTGGGEMGPMCRRETLPCGPASAAGGSGMAGRPVSQSWNNFVVKKQGTFRALFPTENHAEDRWCAYAAKVPRERELEPPVKLGSVLDFMRLLWKMNHELESLSKRLVATAGVTGPQRLVVRIVGRRPDIA